MIQLEAGARSSATIGGNQSLRYERGGGVYAMDGKIGTLRQVLVDEAAGIVLALVVDIDRTKDTILLPPEAIARTGGSAIYLSGNRRQFGEWMAIAPRYHAKQVTRARIKKLKRERNMVGGDPRRTILEAGPEFIETGSTALASPGLQR